MRTSIFLLLSLLLVVGLANAGTVEETCKAAAAKEQGLNYQLCVDAIKGDPIGAGDDLQQQTNAAVNQAVAKTTAAWDKAASLPRGRDPSTDPLLNQCTALYNDLRGSARTALDLLGNALVGPARKSALDELQGARGKSGQCADAFGKAGKPSPLAQESKDASDMLVIAVAVLEVLIG